MCLGITPSPEGVDCRGLDYRESRSFPAEEDREDIYWSPSRPGSRFRTWTGRFDPIDCQARLPWHSMWIRRVSGQMLYAMLPFPSDLRTHTDVSYAVSECQRGDSDVRHRSVIYMAGSRVLEERRSTCSHEWSRRGGHKQDLPNRRARHGGLEASPTIIFGDLRRNIARYSRSPTMYLCPHSYGC